MTQPILTTPQELETWLDAFMAEQMEKLHIPGVTFSLVQSGKLLLTKGYGYANLEQQIPVQSDRIIRLYSLFQLLEFIRFSLLIGNPIIVMPNLITAVHSTINRRDVIPLPTPLLIGEGTYCLPTPEGWGDLEGSSLQGLTV